MGITKLWAVGRDGKVREYDLTVTFADRQFWYEARVSLDGRTYPQLVKGGNTMGFADSEDRIREQCSRLVKDVIESGRFG